MSRNCPALCIGQDAWMADEQLRGDERYLDEVKPSPPRWRAALGWVWCLVLPAAILSERSSSSSRRCRPSISRSVQSLRRPCARPLGRLLQAPSSRALGRPRSPQPSAAGGGLCPAGGSQTQEPPEVRTPRAAPEAVVPRPRSQGGGTRGNQGFPALVTSSRPCRACRRLLLPGSSPAARRRSPPW
jgi:hypothetical protein